MPANDYKQWYHTSNLYSYSNNTYRVTIFTNCYNNHGIRLSFKGIGLKHMAFFRTFKSNPTLLYIKEQVSKLIPHNFEKFRCFMVENNRCYIGQDVNNLLLQFGRGWTI